MLYIVIDDKKIQINDNITKYSKFLKNIIDDHKNDNNSIGNDLEIPLDKESFSYEKILTLLKIIDIIDKKIIIMMHKDDITVKINEKNISYNISYKIILPLHDIIIMSDYEWLFKLSDYLCIDIMPTILIKNIVCMIKRKTIEISNYIVNIAQMTYKINNDLIDELKRECNDIFRNDLSDLILKNFATIFRYIELFKKFRLNDRNHHEDIDDGDVEDIENEENVEKITIEIYDDVICDTDSYDKYIITKREKNHVAALIEENDTEIIESDSSYSTCEHVRRNNLSDNDEIKSSKKILSDSDNYYSESDDDHEIEEIENNNNNNNNNNEKKIRYTIEKYTDVKIRDIDRIMTYISMDKNICSKIINEEKHLITKKFITNCIKLPKQFISIFSTNYIANPLDRDKIYKNIRQKYFKYDNMVQVGDNLYDVVFDDKIGDILEYVVYGSNAMDTVHKYIIDEIDTKDVIDIIQNDKICTIKKKDIIIKLYIDHRNDINEIMESCSTSYSHIYYDKHDIYVSYPFIKMKLTGQVAIYNQPSGSILDTLKKRNYIDVPKLTRSCSSYDTIFEDNTCATMDVLLYSDGKFLFGHDNNLIVSSYAFIVIPDICNVASIKDHNSKNCEKMIDTINKIPHRTSRNKNNVSIENVDSYKKIRLYNKNNNISDKIYGFLMFDNGSFKIEFLG